MEAQPGKPDSAEEALLEESVALFKKCRAVFQLFDRSSGFLLTKDLGSALRALGQIPSDQEVDMMASKLEQDDIYDRGHTKVSFDEFYRVVQENSERKEDIREMVLDSFKCLDPQASGQVDAARLQALLTGMGEPLSQADAKELLQEAGLGKDGRVDYARFVEQLLQFEVAVAGGREATAAARTEERKGSKKKKKG